MCVLRKNVEICTHRKSQNRTTILNGIKCKSILTIAHLSMYNTQGYRHYGTIFLNMDSKNAT